MQEMLKVLCRKLSSALDLIIHIALPTIRYSLNGVIYRGLMGFFVDG